MAIPGNRPCPQCGEPSDLSRTNVYRPFCSRRCRLIDLGDWLDETHRIPDPNGSADPITPPTPDPEARH